LKKRRGVVIGFEYHARYLARVINEFSNRWEFSAFPANRMGMLGALWKLRRADALISFGGPGPGIALAEAADARNIPVAVIWAGSDVLTSAENPFELAVTKHRRYDNVAVAPWLVDELRTLGLDASYLPVGAVDVPDVTTPLPQTFRVLTYLPEPRRSFYGERRVYTIARAMPDVEFVVLGPGQRNPSAPPNVTFAGYVREVSSQIDASSVILRLTEHDGQSILVLEALARGRHVIWTHACPGVHATRDTDDALAKMRELYELHTAHALEVNEAGQRYVREHFEPSAIARQFEDHLDTVVDARASHRNGKQRHHVAISGLGLFCAEVAEQLERLRPDWKASVLSTGSRLEVLSALIKLPRCEVWYSIGSPLPDRWVNLEAKLLRKRRVVHWVGSDIETFKTTASLRNRLQSPAITHLAEVPWTADELESLGMPSQIVPLPLRHYSGGVKALPERFTILFYIPKGRPEFYGKNEYEALLREIADENPRVLVVGGGDLRVPPALETVNFGWRDDLRPILEQTTVLIRLTPRDGLSLMVLEALSFGRYVLWSKPFPYAIRIRKLRDTVEALRSLMQAHRNGGLCAQYAASEMIQQRYSAEHAVGRIARVLEAT
jgi:glycosyltransferase involved in cell wall biosynthesis